MLSEARRARVIGIPERGGARQVVRVRVGDGGVVRSRCTASGTLTLAGSFTVRSTGWPLNLVRTWPGDVGKLGRMGGRRREGDARHGKEKRLDPP